MTTVLLIFAFLIALAMLVVSPLIKEMFRLCNLGISLTVKAATQTVRTIVSTVVSLAVLTGIVYVVLVIIF